MMKPCLKCGEPANDTYCEQHSYQRPNPHKKGQSNRDRQAKLYDSSWRQLSALARRLQPFCELCGSRSNLTADHMPIAHWKLDHGVRIGPYDLRVLCRSCNSKAGPAHAGSPRYELWAASVQLDAQYSPDSINIQQPRGIRSAKGHISPPGVLGFSNTHSSPDREE